jgi:hypothetical protein
MFECDLVYLVVRALGLVECEFGSECVPRLPPVESFLDRSAAAASEASGFGEEFTQAI